MALMNEEWVSFWYQCLALNADYMNYCNARAVDDLTRCREYEARFPKIAEIFEDFGPVEGWPDDGVADDAWVRWFQERKHLFIHSPSLVETQEGHSTLPGHLLLDVPLLASAQETVEAVRQYLEQHYSTHEVIPASQPKYRLHEKGGRVAHGYRQVQTACASVARSYRYDPETFDELRFEAAVAAFVRHEVDNMGWQLDPRARQRLLETGELSEQLLERFKAMLTKCRRDARAFARNTIDGRFPDDTPFESAVLDIF